MAIDGTRSSRPPESVPVRSSFKQLEETSGVRTSRRRAGCAQVRLGGRMSRIGDLQGLLIRSLFDHDGLSLWCALASRGTHHRARGDRKCESTFRIFDIHGRCDDGEDWCSASRLDHCRGEPVGAGREQHGRGRSTTESDNRCERADFLLPGLSRTGYGRNCVRSRSNLGCGRRSRAPDRPVRSERRCADDRARDRNRDCRGLRERMGHDDRAATRPTHPIEPTLPRDYRAHPGGHKRTTCPSSPVLGPCGLRAAPPCCA